MRVVIGVSQFHDWAPCPPDVKVTPQDIAARRVKPSARGEGYDIRVPRPFPSETTIGVSEGTIVARIIHELMPQNGGRQLTRKEAVANLLAMNVMPDHAHPKHFTSIVVDTDDGPDEKLLRASLEPYTKALHASGVVLVDSADVEDIVAKYMEPATAADHAANLRAHFRVKAPARPAAGAGQ